MTFLSHSINGLVSLLSRKDCLRHNHDPVSGGAGGIAARGQMYMGAPIGVVEIHLREKLPTPLYSAGDRIDLTCVIK